MNRSLFCVALLLLATGTVPAGAAQSVLGAAGEIYSVRATTLNDHSVLVFEILRPGAAPELEVVPGTDDDDLETNPALVFEDAGGSAFVLWQKMASGAFPVLNLVGRDDQGWSAPIEIRGNPFAFKTAPQLLVTRDLSLSADGKTQQHRTVIHVVWAEENGSGAYETFYTPLILEDGAYVTDSATYRVANFDHGVGSGGAVSPGLLQAPRMQPGGDANSVVLVFADADRSRIDSLEIRVLPRGLVALGDGARAHIIGADKLGAKTLASLTASVKAYVSSADFGLRPAVLKALAEDVGDFIAAWKSANGTSVALADGARAHIIGTGSDLGAGIGNVVGDGPAREYSVAEIPASSGPAHAMRFTLRSSRVVPALIEGSGFALFASAEGTKTTVASALPDRVVYRESAGQGWAPERALALNDKFTLSAALDMLAERSRNR